MNTSKEDPRVIKTKRNLKTAFRELLTEKTFDQITVKEICECSMISRITFYNFYNDKYDLLEDMIKDMGDKLTSEFMKLQEFNQADDPTISYQNLLDCMLNQYFGMQDIRAKINLDNNTILIYTYYHYMTKTTVDLINHYFDQLKPNFPPEQISSFIVLGLFGYLHNSPMATEEEQRQLRKSAHELLSDLLNSHLFTVHQSAVNNR